MEKKKRTTRTKPNAVKKDQDRTRLAKEKMIKAMVASLGVVKTASAKAKVSRTQHYEWMKTDPEYADQINEISEDAKDFVESKLFEQIGSGNTTATIFFMKCKMRERGYVEKTDVNLNTGRPDLSDLTTDEIRELLKGDE